MNLFHKSTIRFRTPDPLANGLGDEIASEQREADSFQTLDDTSPEDLSRHWNAIVKDIEKDPDWFNFSND